MRVRPAIAAIVMFALALSGHAGAASQARSAPSNAPERPSQASPPKQVGPWTVFGWNHSDGSYCTAERPVPGAAGRGATLYVMLVRFRDGYRLALASADWELKPSTTFQVELIANPVLRSDANAVALNTYAVGIELGADRQLVQRLATVPRIEVKTAQRTFQLPVDALDRASGELDACYGAVKQPANPFAPPAASPKQAPTAPSAPAPGAPPTSSPAPKAPAAKSGPDDSPPAPPSANAGRDTELAEERTFLTVRGKTGPYRLEALVVRPAKADGRLPIALITHGKNGKADENQNVRADIMLPQARDLATRGWLAVAVMRRGYGASDGLPGVSRGAAYMSCEAGDLARGFDVEADDLDAALKAIAVRPDADGTRAIAIGQSLGGGAVLALAARNPAGLLGVVNVSGGAWRSNGDGACDHDPLVAAMAALGGRTRIVSLWLYAENDSLFPPELVRRMRDAYAKAGGRAHLRVLPPVLHDGHNLFADFNGRAKWLSALDGFLRAQVLPNTNDARVDRVMRAARLSANMRGLVANYLSAPMPKALAVSARGAAWAARAEGLDEARKVALTRCRESYGPECTVATENNGLMLPAAGDTPPASGTNH